MHIKSVSAYLGDQISAEQGQQLDTLQNELLALITKVDAICEDVPPAAASAILYHFSSGAVSFARRANERSAKSVAGMIAPPPTVVIGAVTTPTVETPAATPPTVTPPTPISITTVTIDLVATPQTLSSIDQAPPI